jgi:uncharacterized protein DUF922/uncharacterized protein DUF4150
MAEKQIANKLSRPVAVCKNPDICRVDGALVPFDISRDLSHSVKHSPNVNAQGAPVIHVDSVIQGVDGNKGEGVASGVSQGDGHVIVKTGAPNVITNGRCTARHMSECEMNTTASGTSNGTKGYIQTRQSKPLYKKGPPKKFQWKDCNEAVKAMKEMDGETETVGDAKWSLGYRLEGSTAPTSPGTWTFKAKVWSKATVSLPVWENIPDDAALKKAWKDAVDALLVHEEGHVTIAADGAKRLSGVTVTGRGKSVEEALKDAKKQFAERVRKLRDEIDAEEKAYDLKTEHGAAQDVVGGKPAKLICP